MEWHVNNLIERLIAAHRVLNREIRRELARRANGLRLARLRKERVAIKARLARMFPEAPEMRRVIRRALRRARHA